jgi:hypothetical protein
MSETLTTAELEGLVQDWKSRADQADEQWQRSYDELLDRTETLESTIAKVRERCLLTISYLNRGASEFRVEEASDILAIVGKELKMGTLVEPL